ncbi:MAG: hypothetical protein AAGH83_05795 [Pseudomonadota bacterium]
MAMFTAAFGACALAGIASFAETSWPPVGTDVLTVQQGDRASYDGERLTLHNARKTLWFSDRPDRLYGDVSGATYVAAWDEGGTFVSDPPNAVLIGEDGGLSEPVVMILESAEETEDGFRYLVTMISGDMPDELDLPALFVDAGERNGSYVGPGG